LRGDDTLAAEYSHLKRQLAARFPENRAIYTEGKSDFVASVLARR
jgi:GrpB-like predicted nucleotidyltransferase (UPF0157 family)